MPSLSLSLSFVYIVQLWKKILSQNLKRILRLKSLLFVKYISIIRNYTNRTKKKLKIIYTVMHFFFFIKENNFFCFWHEKSFLRKTYVYCVKNVQIFKLRNFYIYEIHLYGKKEKIYIYMYLCDIQ